MTLLTFFIVTFVSSIVLVVWSMLLLRGYKKKRKKIFEGKKTLWVYVIMGAAGATFSLVLVVLSLLNKI